MLSGCRTFAGLVEAAPADHLHMNSWEREAECGTTRCAAGWAGVDEWFNKQGFRLVRDPDWNTRVFFEIDGQVRDPSAALLGKFFGLSWEDSRNLFWTGNYTTSDLEDDPHIISKADVLRQIDRILAGEPTFPYGEEED